MQSSSIIEPCAKAPRQNESRIDSEQRILKIKFQFKMAVVSFTCESLRSRFADFWRKTYPFKTVIRKSKFQRTLDDVNRGNLLVHSGEIPSVRGQNAISLMRTRHVFALLIRLFLSAKKVPLSRFDKIASYRKKGTFFAFLVKLHLTSKKVPFNSYDNDNFWVTKTWTFLSKALFRKVGKV